MSKLKPLVFWPPFLLLLISVTISMAHPAGFLSVTTAVNDWILKTFGWLFSLGTLFMVLVSGLVFVSPLGRVRIGGEEAKPLLSRWRWFSIVLCTTVAIGILFWSTAEPLFHFRAPPQTLGLEPGSPEAARFALSALFLHWSLTPYAIYAVPALTFALAYYNLERPFSLGAPLSPLLGRWVMGVPGNLIDAVCLFCLVAGMAASLGTGILTLAGGLHHLVGIPSSVATWVFVAVAVVGSFVLSAASGLMKGIRLLSDINTKVFLGLAAFVFLFGPTLAILVGGARAMGDYLSNFLQLSLLPVTAAADPWPRSWSVFYWANWLSWAPVTALFLGRIAYGYRVRDFFLVNLLAPALFSCCWMAIFGGSSLALDQASGGALRGALETLGPESVVYNLFSRLPWSQLVAGIFVATSFLSYVTAADSNTDALGGLSSTGISPSSPNPPLLPKVVWGVTIGTVALVMVTFAGIDGVKMLSNLGGLPALFLVLGITAALLRLTWRYSVRGELGSPDQ